MEADRYQAQSHQFESEASNIKLQLKTRESDIRNLQDKTEQLEKDLEEVLSIFAVRTCIYFFYFYNIILNDLQ